jgi:hypothetical protein
MAAARQSIVVMVRRVFSIPWQAARYLPLTLLFNFAPDPDEGAPYDFEIMKQLRLLLSLVRV